MDGKVCMEDAPAKPSPEPVLMALKKLNVKRALMIGDTPDDIRAASGAGVVGIGVSLLFSSLLLTLSFLCDCFFDCKKILSPGDKKSPDMVKIKGSLVGAGAARVIDNVSELLSICARASKKI